MALVESGELQFSELKDQLGVHQQTLSNALSDLQTSGFVEKKPGEKIGLQSSGAYAVTQFGKQILDGLYQASWPKVDRTGTINGEIDLVKSTNVEGATFDMPDVSDVKETEKISTKDDNIGKIES